MLMVLIAAVVAFLGVAIVSPFLIPHLHRLKIGQWVRTDGPRRHLTKKGTPTMGGIIIIIGAFAGLIAVKILFGVTTGWLEGVTLFAATCAFAALGFGDDYLKVVLRQPLGLRAREKILGQIVLAIIIVIVTTLVFDRGTNLLIPFSGYFVSGGISVVLADWLYYLLAIFVLLGSVNAVNLTDGLDGLAAGSFAVAALAFAFIAFMVGEIWVALVLSAFSGSALGFLLFNYHPAKVFMGDTGSLALGGCLGTAAIITRSELFLLLIGLIFVVEALSVIIQVFSFQIFQRRVFKMSPLHHHFELVGWSEKKVVNVFLLVGVVCALFGLAAFARI